MVVHLSNEYKFIPTWNGNSSEPNPIEVTFKAPTMSLYSNLIPKPNIKMKMDINGNMAGGETEMVIDNSKLVKDMVTDIKNLTYVVDGGKEVTIKDGKELFGTGVPSVFSGLVDEIGAHLQGVLNNKVVDPKN